MSWDDTEPTVGVPRGPGDPEPTRPLRTAPGNPYAAQPPPNPYAAQPPGNQVPQNGGAPGQYGRPGENADPGRAGQPGGYGRPDQAAYGAHPQQAVQPGQPGQPWRPVYPGQAWPTEPYDPYARSMHPQQSGAFTPAPPVRSGRVTAIAAGVALLVGLIAGAGAALGVVALDDRPAAGETPVIGNGPQPKIREGSVADVANRLLPSVVQLKVEGNSERGTGSGFVIDDAGHILTNNHVVAVAESGGSIQVVTDKGITSSAKLVGRSPAYDLAVVQVDNMTAPAVQFGQSASAVVGMDVVAIGSPLGLAGTVTSGIISAKNRPVTAGGEGEISYINALQTDAAINPGNSGGPLVDMAGKVIGVNSAIATVRGAEQGTSGSIGLGFAIPIDQARRTAEQLISTGKASYPVIGANVDMTFEGGAKISTITAGSPAQRAGIKTGDIVTSIANQKVDSAEGLIVAIRARRPGERVELDLQRDGKLVQVNVTLGSKTG